MKLHIVGTGVFGMFLHDLLEDHVEFHPDADNVILAVPVSAYREVAEQHKGKHLINVCSVQHMTNFACSHYSEFVTGIHPMFGPNSPAEGRTCIVTKTCAKSDRIVKLFDIIGCEIVTGIKGNIMTDKIHDDIMRRTHLPVLAFGELAALIVEHAGDIPDNCLPTSFKRLKELAVQIKDVSPGTVESIRSNL